MLEYFFRIIGRGVGGDKGGIGSCFFNGGIFIIFEEGEIYGVNGEFRCFSNFKI